MLLDQYLCQFPSMFPKIALTELSSVQSTYLPLSIEFSSVSYEFKAYKLEITFEITVQRIRDNTNLASETVVLRLLNIARAL